MPLIWTVTNALDIVEYIYGHMCKRELTNSLEDGGRWLGLWGWVVTDGRGEMVEDELKNQS